MAKNNKNEIKRIIKFINENPDKLLQIYQYDYEYCIGIFPNDYKIENDIIYTNHNEKIPIKKIERIMIWF